MVKFALVVGTMLLFSSAAMTTADTDAVNRVQAAEYNEDNPCCVSP